MNKPPSMSIKEYLVKRIAVNKVWDKMISEKTIDAVISHQFDSASAATATNNSIEISGFGKFMFNEKRAIKQMQKYTEQIAYYSKMLSSELTEAERRNTEMRLESINNNVKALKPKLNEPSTDNRGMEE
jgi:nucleoid DNA-binding protein